LKNEKERVFESRSLSIIRRARGQSDIGNNNQEERRNPMKAKTNKGKDQIETAGTSP
jgi:hypothetical protein